MENMRAFLEEAKRIIKFDGGNELVNKETVKTMEGLVDEIEEKVDNMGIDLDNIEKFGDPDMNELMKITDDLITPEALQEGPSAFKDKMEEVRKALAKQFPDAKIHAMLQDKDGSVKPIGDWDISGMPKSRQKAAIPNFEERNQKLLKDLETRSEKLDTPPDVLVKTIEAWLKDKWKSPTYWESIDQIEQTWHLQALVRLFFKAAKSKHTPEFAQGAREWGSEIFGEHRKMKMGQPSIVWALHEAIHLASDIDDEEKAWIATIKLVKAAFANIDPAYAEAKLTSEFNNPPDPTPRAKAAGSWAGRSRKEESD